MEKDDIAAIFFSFSYVGRRHGQWDDEIKKQEGGEESKCCLQYGKIKNISIDMALACVKIVFIIRHVNF